MNYSRNYIGNELHLFSKAGHWKKYYGNFLNPFLKGNVLEVGAGIGGTTMALCDGTQESWTCLEPDFEMSSHIENLISNKQIPSCCNVKIGTISNLPETSRYDSILYIDVIEHIKEDASEIHLASKHLSMAGKMIILVPAHQCIYSPFDKAIGHHRRYNKATLRKTIPRSLKEIELVYLDSFGLLASIANKMILKQFYPSEKQIAFWDSVMIKASKCIDPVLLYSLGKSLLGIWEKN